jgi:hypothetical protein
VSQDSIGELDLASADELHQLVQPLVAIRMALVDAQETAGATLESLAVGAGPDRAAIAGRRLARRAVLPLLERLLREYRQAGARLQDWIPHDEHALEGELHGAIENANAELLQGAPETVTRFLEEVQRLSDEASSRIRELEY